MKKPYLLLALILVVLVGALAIVRGVARAVPMTSAPGNGVVKGRARRVRQERCG